MRQSLLAFVLSLVALACGARCATAADPLDGKVFRSVEKLTGGERRDGKVNLIHWEITFKDRSFSWRHADVISRGTYELDQKTGTLKVSNPNVEASFDAKTGELTWGKQKYRAVKK
jgi:hypothetical protein